jgi:hypothetical protein
VSKRHWIPDPDPQHCDYKCKGWEKIKVFENRKRRNGKI